MKVPESPEGWQQERKPRAPVETEERKQVQLVGYAFVTLLLVAGVAGYLYIARDSSLAGAVPLPKALATKSAGHDDLMRVGRELLEAAKDAQQRLGFHDAASAAAGQRLQRRIDTLRTAGHKLEPKLTRDETRTLMAFDQAVRFLTEYVSTASQGTGDETLLTQARQQIANGVAVGRGEHVEDLILSKRSAAVSKTLDDLHNVRNAKLRLVDH